MAAVDGQPTDTFEPLRSTLPFAPGSRYDLFLDMPTASDGKAAVVALVGPGPAARDLRHGAGTGGPPRNPSRP